MAAVAAAATAAAVLPVACLGMRRVVVEGRSMVPAFQPGDRVLVARLPRAWPLRPGIVVAVPDPREPDRLLLKRVAVAGPARPGGAVVLAGDNAEASTDSRTFGPVARQEVWGRVVYRYAPAGRAGRIA